MPIDPRMFLGISGPVPQQPMLPPGFHAAPMPNAPPIMQQGGGGMGGIPGMGGMGALAGMMGGGGESPFKGVDVSSMTPDQQIAAFSTYGNKGPSPFQGMDVSGMNTDQQIGAFSSYSPQSNWPDWARKIGAGIRSAGQRLF